jgi:hypothetical protein
VACAVSLELVTPEVPELELEPELDDVVELVLLLAVELLSVAA